MRKLSTILMSVVSLTAFAATASAGTEYYQRYYGQKYRQAVSQAAAALGNAQTVQGSIGSQRAAFNGAMASGDVRAKSQAKRVFLGYLYNLERALLAAENAYAAVVHWGLRYAYSLESLRRTSAQGRAIRALAGTYHSQQRSLLQTRSNVQTEMRTVRRRR